MSFIGLMKDSWMRGVRSFVLHTAREGQSAVKLGISLWTSPAKKKENFAKDWQILYHEDKRPLQEVLSMNKSSLFYGLLVGATAGAVSVLFTTPASGKRIREAIKNNSGDFIESAKRIAENVKDLKESVESFSTEGKKVATNVMEEIQHCIEEWQKSIEPNKEALQNEIKDIRKTIENMEQQMEKKSS
ncbi:YtxH domain-containing protein [Heyndrickxia faecalis]